MGSPLRGKPRRTGRPHKTRILDEFCATCGYLRKTALRLLGRPLRPRGARARPGSKRTYDPGELLPGLKVIWLASDQPCSKLRQAALPEWLAHHERQHAPLPTAAPPGAHPRRPRPGTVAVDTVAHCDDTTAGNHVNSLTFTELQGWTENRAVWHKASHASLGQVKELEAQVPFVMTSFHSDNGSERIDSRLNVTGGGGPSGLR